MVRHVIEGFNHLDLGGEVLHDGADELDFVRGESGGVAAGGGGFGGVVHGGSDGVLALVWEFFFSLWLRDVFGVSSGALWR